MSDVLLNRRREMMGLGKDYSADYVPLFFNAYDKQTLMAQYGDFFKVLEEAPATHGGRSKHMIGVLSASTTSYTIAGNLSSSVYLIVYEGNRIVYSFAGNLSSATTLTFNDSSSPKYLVSYGGIYAGRNSMQVDIASYFQNVSYDTMYYTFAPIASYIYYKKGTTLFAPKCIKTTGYAYLPDGFTQQVNFGYLRSPKVRIPRSCRDFNNYPSSTGGSVRTITDVYVHWQQGEIPIVTYNSGTKYGFIGLEGNIKLHVPQGLRQAYIDSKTWSTNVFKGGVYDDVETAEPIPEF